MTVSDKSIEQLANAVSNLVKTTNQNAASDKAAKVKFDQLLDFLAKDATRKEKLEKEREAKNNAKRPPNAGAGKDKGGTQQTQAEKKALKDKANSDKKISSETLGNLKAQGQATKKMVDLIEGQISSLDDRVKKPEKKTKELLDRLKKSGDLPQEYFDKIDEVSKLLLESIKISESLAKPSRTATLTSTLSSKIFQMPGVVSGIPFEIEKGFKNIQMKGVYKKIDLATEKLNEIENELKSHKAVFKDSTKSSSDEIIAALDGLLDVLSNPSEDKKSASPETKMLEAMDSILEKIDSVKEKTGISIGEAVDELLKLNAEQFATIVDKDELFYAQNSLILQKFSESTDLFSQLGVDITEELAAGNEANDAYYKYIKDKDEDANMKVKLSKREAVNNVVNNEFETLKKDTGGWFGIMAAGLIYIGYRAYQMWEIFDKCIVKPVKAFIADVKESRFVANLSAKFSKFGKILDDFSFGMFSKIGNTLKKVKDLAISPFVWIYEKIKGLSSMTVSPVIDWFKNTFGKLGTFFKDIGNSKTVKAISEAFSFLGGKLGFLAGLLKPLGFLARVAGSVFSAIIFPIQAAMSLFDIAEGFSGSRALEVFGDIKSTVTEADSIVLGIATTIVEAVSLFFDFFTFGLFGLVTDWAFGDDWQKNLSGSMARVFDWVGTLIGESLFTIVDSIKGFVTPIINFLGSIGTSIGGGLFKMVDFVTNLLTSGNMWADLGKAITNGFIFAVNILPNVLNSMIDVLANWMSSLGQMFGMSKIVPAKIPNIPYLELSFDKREAGGPLRKGVPTKVGEKGPEIIVSELDGMKVLNHNQTVQTENNMRKIENNVYEKEKTSDKSGSIEEMVALTKKFGDYLSQVNKPIVADGKNSSASVVNNYNSYSSSQVTGSGKQSGSIFIHSGSIFDKLIKEF